MKIVKQVTLDCAVVDDAHWFKLGYSADLHTHLMVVSVAWVAGYERYYRIGADDRALYASDRASFYRKYANEIEQSGNTCYTERLIGAQALRDYDGRRNSFQRAYPAKYGNPFQHYAYIGGILFARILWNGVRIMCRRCRQLMWETAHGTSPCASGAVCSATMRGSPYATTI